MEPPTECCSSESSPIGGEAVMAELDAHDAGKPGDRIAVRFDLEHFILIEPESGKVLGQS